MEAGQWVREAGIELSEYVMIGIGGKERTKEHAHHKAGALNAVNPHFIRLRTFLPKVDTLLLHQIKKGRFHMLSPHEALRETGGLIRNLDVNSRITSDHYTNYVDVQGAIPGDRDRMLAAIESALRVDEKMFRPCMWGPSDERRLFEAEAAYAESVFRGAIGDMDASISAAELALNIKPDYPPAVLTMGSIEYQRGRPDELARENLRLCRHARSNTSNGA